MTILQTVFLVFGLCLIGNQVYHLIRGGRRLDASQRWREVVWTLMFSLALVSIFLPPRLAGWVDAFTTAWFALFFYWLWLGRAIRQKT